MFSAFGPAIWARRVFRRPAFLVLAAFLILIACVSLPWMTNLVEFSTVEFPSGSGAATLTRRQLKIGPELRLETWTQPSNFSYSIWYPFERAGENGETLQCRYEVEGWFRPKAKRGNPASAFCICELRLLHHDRSFGCKGP